MNLPKSIVHRAMSFSLCIVATFSVSSEILFAWQAADNDEESAIAGHDTHQKQIVEIQLPDNETLKGQLCLPATDEGRPIRTLIVFVQGTGPGTYLNKRKIGDQTFNYFDYFSNQLNNQGVAFFAYNKRGVTIGETPPMFDDVDREKFRRVVPSVEVQDLATIVDFLKQDDRLTGAKVALLGWSEGTIIAAMVAEQYPDKIDALLLAGYSNENLFDVIRWQYSGHASMLRINPVFDKDGDRRISRDEYESEDANVAKFRKSAMRNANFELLDATKDGQLEAEDFRIRQKPLYSMLLYHTARENEDWIWKHYFRISIPWLQEHFSLEPNKTRLSRLDLPIYIFHGTDDAHLDVEGVHQLESRFKALGKTNLKTFVFEEHDHDLNFLEWALQDEMPEGFTRLFEIASSLGESDE